jgi:hypothetical protein
MTNAKFADTQKQYEAVEIASGYMEFSQWPVYIHWIQLTILIYYSMISNNLT